MMILAILFKIIPWYFGITLSPDALGLFAFGSGAELFVEIVVLAVQVFAIIQERQEALRRGEK